MNTVVAFILVVKSLTGGYSFAEFNDKDACIDAMKLVIIDWRARGENVLAECKPKSSQPKQ